MSPRKMCQGSIDEVIVGIFDDRISVDSGERGNQPFFSTQLQPLLPSHTSSVTWKSDAVKEKEEYERIKQRVRHFAPEQFKTNAKPGRGPSEIFPQNPAEWVVHKKEILAMAEAEKQKNCEWLKAQINAQQKIPKHQRKIKSAFGKKDGKVFHHGLSPVLALPTIWSADYLGQAARWPSAGELQWNGDSRQSVLAKTKCSRFRPPPRVPGGRSAQMQEPPFSRPLPLDQTGPIFTDGPRPDEVQVSNADMNEDPEFEAHGNFYLGTELMQELGEWGPVFVPEWQKAQLVTGELVPVQYGYMGQYMDLGFGHGECPCVTGEFWCENPQAQVWEEYPSWWRDIFQRAC
ncbi:uncharacterized protein Z518_06174 [Rhinocladiella mackenziei CBS 650.93]|uniref:Uncharacterized protein n=1 Tax=Rhinocladiella mackenziei CBS 650.93 TaxID=1442369 RepID=A0A0D2FT65_9EURO|nr:uncharacterized protein Z518_06174 [Rhinocladiella mackenziei CBS 650.93]KIX05302.1 hypothetical protein Z518_06174 [Rhinocladiella mackenziei CBS 650.93]